jgi:outer membrane protein TolC
MEQSVAIPIEQFGNGVQQQTLVSTYRYAARLSEIRYRGGVTTFLEVLLQ